MKEEFMTSLQRERENAKKFVIRRYEEDKDKVKKSILCRIIAQEIRERYPLLSFWGEQNVRNVIRKHEHENIKDWRSLV